MKKLLLVAIVATGAVHQISPMIFRKSNNNQNVPVFQPEVRIADELWNSSVVQGEFFTCETEKKPVLQYNSKDLNGNFIAGEIKGEVINTVVNDISVINKKWMKPWRDNFKKNSKRPAMWTKDAQEEKEIENVDYCFLGKNDGRNIVDNLTSEIVKLNNKKSSSLKSDFEFLHKIEDVQKNEWNTWQQDPSKENKISGIKVTYKEPVSNKQSNSKYAGLQLTQRPSRSVDSFKYFIAFTQSPYYKKSKESSLAHELENNAYHNALQSLQATKDAIERDLDNQSYFQRLWNYTQRQNTRQALARVDEEIASFKDQDRIVSQEKEVYKRGDETAGISSMVDKKQLIKATDGKYYSKKAYLKPELTHRQVFTRSCMPQTMSEQVIRARE